MFGRVTKYIHFHNDTDLPVMVDAWVDGSNALKCLKIDPQTRMILHSSVGEWHLNSMFPNSKDDEIWKKKNIDHSKYLNIGKFSSDPCASGNYSWMEYDDPFECVYSEFDEPQDNVRGLITFRVKS